jgi:NADH-quinone oxidoreductase subunit F
MAGDGKKVTGVEFVRCASVFDDKGKFNPSFDESTTKNIEADTVICAIGQSTDFSFMGKEITIARGAITVDPLTMATNLPGVFAGGDAVSGTASGKNIGAINRKVPGQKKVSTLSQER